MKNTEEYQCGYADGYDAGFWECRFAALEHLREHASDMVDIYNDLLTEYDGVKLKKWIEELKKNSTLRSFEQWQ